MVGVGTLTTGVTAEVDAYGTVRRGAVRLAWRVRSGNDWLEPGAGSTPRQSRPTPAPVVHTALRIPGGDAIQRVYAVGDGDGALVVVEIENDSPEAIAVAFVVDAPGVVTTNDDGVVADGNRVLAWSRRPAAVEDGNRFVYPVPHRTTVRVVLVGSDVEFAGDVRALADADAVARAWDRMLDRGLRTELPEPLQSGVDAARADLLLAPPTADAFVALEAWGFDEDAVEMWARLGIRARRAARRGATRGLLGETLAALVREDGDILELFPGFRVAWLGQHLAAHDIPLRRGTCSFAVRWHGSRPALLWDVPPGTTVRAPALDSGWSSNQPVGETLLAEPPTSLLAMGGGGPVTGTSVDAPEQFS
ncbi:MAG: hypothetical protein QOF59_252 [Actinomycetota bacterium]|jgi:hypothetical protein|nr:hypothetical protein [Actinomycetota bacterium]